jgi:hypothetical protein
MAGSATKTQRATTKTTTGDSPSKQQLQKQMQKTRESMAQTVDEIKETVNKQVSAAKEVAAGVLDYREQFQKEPLVWSLGALSAGFALGYTMGYAHKETKGSRNKSQMAAFTNTLVDELGLVGNSVVMPALNARISELFGVDFSQVLESIGSASKNGAKRKTLRKKSQPAKRKRKKTA